ncbi:MAG: CoB--CoM heterodisulfide reductase iron-sulfur subunit A family protein, partial [bacterium]|nr:CoB--CoM heterodisulfide reductase iron-sulfur subunit A family protein [bacterium]
QATYVRDQYPEAEIHMFYIDVRSPGRLEDFYTKRQEDEKLFFHRGKVAKIVESGSKLTVKAENTLTNEMQEVTVDMAVLATGMVPSVSNGDIPADLTKDEFGFIVPGVDPKSGIIAAGTATRPLEVSGSIQDATGAAVEVLKAMARR